MAVNNYECTMILDSNAYSRDPGGTAQIIKEMIEQSGGHVLASRLWQEQKLAYAIRGRHKGTYWVSYFEMPADQLKAFRRRCQLTDMILRQLTIKIDSRLIGPMVAAAQGVRVSSVTDDSTDEAGVDSANGSAEVDEAVAVETEVGAD